MLRHLSGVPFYVVFIVSRIGLYFMGHDSWVSSLNTICADWRVFRVWWIIIPTAIGWYISVVLSATKCIVWFTSSPIKICLSVTILSNPTALIRRITYSKPVAIFPFTICEIQIPSILSFIDRCWQIPGERCAEVSSCMIMMRTINSLKFIFTRNQLDSLQPLPRRCQNQSHDIRNRPESRTTRSI